MREPDHIAELVFKYLRNVLSPKEQEELSVWRAETVTNEALFQKMTDPGEIRDMMQAEHYKQKTWARLQGLIPELRPDYVEEPVATEAPATSATAETADEPTGSGHAYEPEIKKPGWTRLAVAAAILVIAGSTIVLYLSKSPKQITTAEKIEKPKILIDDIPPGSDKAILTLSNGSTIILDSARNGLLAEQGGTKVMKTDSGRLDYSNAQVAAPNLELFNTLATPRGGQFQLILPDGTKVWLNAASKIKYPVSFTAEERRVEISGEVYFEVTKDATKPFKVKVGDVEVQVLGTHFNISAYPEEPAMQTTLLEGSVKVSGGGISKQITPGQQAVISNQSIRIIPEVDVTSIIAWKNGRTLFKDATIPQIMRMISRWYDVDVEYAGAIPDKTLNGGIPRTATLNQLIKVLETYGVHIKKEGKKIIVMP